MKTKLVVLLSCLVVLTACGNSGNQTVVFPQTQGNLRVQVLDEFGKKRTNAVVILGDQTGAMVSMAPTDGLGEADFASPPPNATVTAAVSCFYAPSARTYYDINTVYEVEGPAVALTLSGCGQNSQQVTITIADAVAGIADHDVTLGPLTYGGSGNTFTLDVYELQDDGKISAIATGYDAGSNFIAYGLALDQPFTNGSALDIAIDRTDLLRNTHHFSNVPSTAVSYFAYAALIRKHATTFLPYNYAADAAPLPAAITTYSIPGFADNNLFQAGLELDRDSDGQVDAELGLFRYQPRASDQLFDFSAAPVVPGGLTYDQGSAGRPVITWSNIDPQATLQTLVISYSTTTPKASYSYTLTVPAGATKLVYPEFPGFLENLRPGGYSDLTLQTLKFNGPVSYQDYLQAVADNKGRFYEAAGLNKYSYARIERVP